MTDETETVEVPVEYAEIAAFELNHLVESTGGRDGERYNTPLAEAKRRIEEAAPSALTVEIEKGMMVAAGHIEDVGEDRGVETAAGTDPLTDGIIQAADWFQDNV
jgi:hypothetical protein